MQSNLRYLHFCIRFLRGVLCTTGDLTPFLDDVLVDQTFLCSKCPTLVCRLTCATVVCILCSTDYVIFSRTWRWNVLCTLCIPLPYRASTFLAWIFECLEVVIESWSRHFFTLQLPQSNPCFWISFTVLLCFITIRCWPSSFFQPAWFIKTVLWTFIRFFIVFRSWTIL